jgi:protein-S-isoprenylcysteine O-methyltransferase Ste14
MNVEIDRIFLGLFMIAFSLVIGIPIHRQKLKPITFYKSISSAGRLMERGLLVGVGLWVAWFFCFIVLGYTSPFFRWIGRFFTFGGSQITSITLTGMAVMSFGLFLIWLAIREMRDEWRIGIDECEPQEKLVTTGIFTVMRHPTYIGIILITLGALGVMPHIVTFFLCCFSICGVVIQMKLEDIYLRERFGKTYVDYRNS